MDDTNAGFRRLLIREYVNRKETKLNRYVGLHLSIGSNVCCLHERAIITCTTSCIASLLRHSRSTNTLLSQPYCATVAALLSTVVFSFFVVAHFWYTDAISISNSYDFVELDMFQVQLDLVAKEYFLPLSTPECCTYP